VDITHHALLEKKFSPPKKLGKRSKSGSEKKYPNCGGKKNSWGFTIENGVIEEMEGKKPEGVEKKGIRGKDEF